MACDARRRGYGSGDSVVVVGCADSYHFALGHVLASLSQRRSCRSQRAAEVSRRSRTMNLIARAHAMSLSPLKSYDLRAAI